MCQALTELVFKRTIRTKFTLIEVSLATLSIPLGAPALHHEPWYKPMEGKIVVAFGLAQFEEVLTSLGCFVAMDEKSHGAI